MARDFDGTSSEFLSNANAQVTAEAFTVNAWFNADVLTGTGHTLWSQGRSDGSSGTDRFVLCLADSSGGSNAGERVQCVAEAHQGTWEAAFDPMYGLLQSS